MALAQENNTYDINLPGMYKDPESGKELEVTMYAGADALVRMGWVRVGDGEQGAKSTADVAPATDDVESKKGK
jgi:hypothetical protein